MKNKLVFLVVFVGIYGVVKAWWKELHDSIPESLNPLTLLYTNRCIEDLGCFYTGPPFYHPVQRPLSLPPVENPEVKFQLFTNVINRNVRYDLEPTSKSLKNSTFNPNRRTIFLIHGFGVELDFNDIRFDIKNEFLKHSDYNVIVIDWTAHNGPVYSQAVANTRVVGAVAARFIRFLMKETGIKAENIYIVGHSLGAHISGYIGERIKNIGRITGLDPAGPFFHQMPNEVRLDRTDAKFVDVIHTDGGDLLLQGLGLSQPLGDVDFYPNGGWRQVGCTRTANNQGSRLARAFNFTTKWLGDTCDHSRANHYFNESINNRNCKFLGVLCDSYSDFESGKCPPTSNNIMEMGFHAKPLRQKNKPSASFYLRTNAESPFCLQSSINIRK